VAIGHWNFNRYSKLYRLFIIFSEACPVVADPMSDQLVAWMHKVLPFSKNARTHQDNHCADGGPWADASVKGVKADSRNASPLHCSSSPTNNKSQDVLGVALDVVLDVVFEVLEVILDVDLEVVL
ncbi:hypothetical protein HPB47_001895, partial [Ixodes persulcatus]